MKRLAVLISGRGSNFKAIAENIENGILKDLCKIEVVISNNPKANGLKIAKDFNIPTKIFDYKELKKNNYNKQLYGYLAKINPDLIVLAGYMKIIPPEIVDFFNKKIINIHPADTSLHQGLNGYKWAFENNLKFTKITVHYVDSGLDTGEVIAKKIVDLQGAKSLQEVEERGLKAEHKFYSECIKKVITENLNGKNSDN